jgi:hypothetical protein
LWIRALPGAPNAKTLETLILRGFCFAYLYSKGVVLGFCLNEFMRVYGLDVYKNAFVIVFKTTKVFLILQAACKMCLSAAWGILTKEPLILFTSTANMSNPCLNIFILN